MPYHCTWRARTPWAEERLDADVRAVPTMLSASEGRFYHWLARTGTDGESAVVDLGAFAGGSAARLAGGLTQVGSAARLHLFDRFTVSDELKERMLYPAGVAPFPGNSILPLARRHMAPWSDRTEFHPGAIEDLGWTGGPIGLLCVDAFKQADTTDAMVAQFFPSLVPGRSIVVQQDFLLPAMPWIVALMWALRDVFEPVAVARPTSLAFRVKARVTPRHIRRARTADLTDGQLLDAIAATRAAYRGWGIGHRLTRMEEAIHATPGCRVAWRMGQAEDGVIAA